MPEQSVVGPDIVIAAVQRVLARICGALGPRGLVKQIDRAALFVTGVALPTLNGVLITRPDAQAREVDALLTVVANQGLPYCLQLRPGADPELDALALERGMRPEDPIPLMALEQRLAGLDQDAGLPSLVIRELSVDEGGIHAAIAGSGFEAPAELFEQLITPAVLTLAGVRCYVGTVDDRPVTTAIGFTERDHVGIFNVATAPEQRGHGYGQAITAHAVLDGFRSGASFAYLQSSDVGYNVYQRLGFRTLENWKLWTYSPELSPATAAQTRS